MLLFLNQGVDPSRLSIAPTVEPDRAAGPYDERMSETADPTSLPVYVANTGDGEIVTYHLDDAGKLTRHSVCALAPGNTALCLDAERDRMFAATRSKPPTIATLSVSPDGELAVTANAEAPGSINYISVDATGRSLLAVSYSGGFVISLPINDDGSLGEVSARFEHRNPHSVIISPDNHHAYAAALGDDVIAQYELTHAGLVPLDPPTVDAPDGSGPRHLVSAKDGRQLYCMTEFSGEVIRYERDATSGRLTRREAVPAFDQSRGLRHSVFGADPVKEHLIWGADLHLNSDESLLFASERCESTLVGVSVNADGVLGEQVSITDTEAQPRGFDVSEDNFLVATGERSTQASVYRINAAGTLTRTCQVENGDTPNWVTIS